MMLTLLVKFYETKTDHFTFNTSLSWDEDEL